MFANIPSGTSPRLLSVYFTKSSHRPFIYPTVFCFSKLDNSEPLDDCHPFFHYQHAFWKFFQTTRRTRSECAQNLQCCSPVGFFRNSSHQNGIERACERHGWLHSLHSFLFVPSSVSRNPLPRSLDFGGVLQPAPKFRAPIGLSQNRWTSRSSTRLYPDFCKEGYVSYLPLTFASHLSSCFSCYQRCQPSPRKRQENQNFCKFLFFLFYFPSS